MKKPSSRRWPGNIPELENLIEGSVILTRGTALQAPMAELSSQGSVAAVAGTPGHHIFIDYDLLDLATPGNRRSPADGYCGV